MSMLYKHTKTEKKPFPETNFWKYLATVEFKYEHLISGDSFKEKIIEKEIHFGKSRKFKYISERIEYV
jgi:hypothetical protein